MVVSLLAARIPAATSAGYPARMDEDRHPSEPQRAAIAIVLGALLGILLAIAGRARRRA